MIEKTEEEIARYIKTRDFVLLEIISYSIHFIKCSTVQIVYAKKCASNFCFCCGMPFCHCWLCTRKVIFNSHIVYYFTVTYSVHLLFSLSNIHCFSMSLLLSQLQLSIHLWFRFERVKKMLIDNVVRYFFNFRSFYGS